jgi:dolichol kinase/phosphoserine phosphatase
MSLQKEKRKLIIFDVEGVLLPKKRFLFFEMSRNLHLLDLLKLFFYGFLYELGLTSLKSSLSKIFQIFKGKQIQDFLCFFENIPLMPDVEKVLENLRTKDWIIALISSGLPIFIVQDLALKLKADYAFGFNVKLNNDGFLTGEIWGDVLESKFLVFKKILASEKLTLRDCVVVADDRNNIPLFLPEILKIGYNPDFLINTKSNFSITGSLSQILPYIIGDKPESISHLPSRNEILRESIHICGFSIPFLSIKLGTHIVALIIICVSILYVMSEFARMKRKTLPLFSVITQRAATYHERYEFATSPLFFALGILLTLFFFPSPINYASIAIFSFGDSTAAIFGNIYGKKKLSLNKLKTLEGSLIGFFFAFLAGTVFVHPLIALTCAIIAMVVEYLPLPLNDNLLIPLTIALYLTLIFSF